MCFTNLFLVSYFVFWLENWTLELLIVGATLACGTGACATVVAAVLEGHAERVSIACNVERERERERERGEGRR